MVGQNPSSAGELPFCIRIPADKEALAREAENAIKEIQVFTDSSAQGGKVRAAAILIRNNRPICTLHYHLGPESEHTVHEAELACYARTLRICKDCDEYLRVSV